MCRKWLSQKGLYASRWRLGNLWGVVEQSSRSSSFDRRRSFIVTQLTQVWIVGFRCSIEQIERKSSHKSIERRNIQPSPDSFISDIPGRVGDMAEGARLECFQACNYVGGKQGPKCTRCVQKEGSDVYKRQPFTHGVNFYRI